MEECDITAFQGILLSAWAGTLVWLAVGILLS